MRFQQSPQICKVQKVKGRTLLFRDARESDAEFILSLRTDEQKSRYLNVTPTDLASQVIYLRQYSLATDQAYFLIEQQGEKIGTVRLYDAQGHSFCWGSWIIADGQAPHVAIESALMVYSYALDHLGFQASHFEVRKANQRGCSFHERFGAVRMGQTELNYLFCIDEKSIRSSLFRFRRYLPSSLDIQLE